jgi:hypothetical protein
VPNLALLGAALLALGQLAATRSIDPLYDIKPMAQAIGQVQAQGLPVVNAANYHAQYQFLGRLEKPLLALYGAELRPWLTAHPEAYVVIYLKDRQKTAAIPARYKQAYRGGEVALVDARTAVGLLPAHAE